MLNVTLWENDFYHCCNELHILEEIALCLGICNLLKNDSLPFPYKHYNLMGNHHGHH